MFCPLLHSDPRSAMLRSKDTGIFELQVARGCSWVLMDVLKTSCEWEINFELCYHSITSPHLNESDTVVTRIHSPRARAKSWRILMNSNSLTWTNQCGQEDKIIGWAELRTHSSDQGWVCYQKGLELHRYGHYWESWRCPNLWPFD